MLRGAAPRLNRGGTRVCEVQLRGQGHYQVQLGNENREAQLDGWLRDGSAKHIESLCEWE